MLDDGERARGLMFRRAMQPDHGMLFDFEREQMVAFWMKNTPLPLDMLFIDDAGTLSYGALQAGCRQVAAWLDEAGVAPGQTVSLVMPMAPCTWTARSTTRCMTPATWNLISDTSSCAAAKPEAPACALAWALADFDGPCPS